AVRGGDGRGRAGERGRGRACLRRPPSDERRSGVFGTRQATRGGPVPSAPAERREAGRCLRHPPSDESRSGAFGTRRATRGGPGGPGTNGPGTNGPGTSGRGERPGHERPGRTGGASDRGDPATAARTRYTSRVLPANRPAVYADLLAL